MTHATIGKWGKSLAIRVPVTIARAAGLADGETVEVETQDGDILIRRPGAHHRSSAAAAAAADEIITESRRHSLGGISIRALLEDGRRG